MTIDVWKLRPADLRRIAAKTEEPERERKLLRLAEELEARQKAAMALVHHESAGTSAVCLG
jgi:hypothetical protein